MTTRARVTHTPCGQPVDLTDGNRIHEPDTTLEHHCPVTDGPTNVTRHGSRWTLDNVLDSTQRQPLFATRHEAQAEADRRNTAYAQAHQPQPKQTGLFDSREATG